MLTDDHALDRRTVPPFRIQPDSPLTIWGQVYDDLRRRLDSGEFADGDRMPSEVSLIARYGVSRVSVRRAVAALVADGSLVSRPGSGTYVTGPAVPEAVDIDLARPWREQIITAGHRARTLVVEEPGSMPLDGDLARAFAGRIPAGDLLAAVMVHTVDGIPIGVTYSWRTDEWKQRDDDGRPVYGGLGGETVLAECVAHIGASSREHARLLDVKAAEPVYVVLARSTMATTGELAELAKTLWSGSRVRLAFKRRYTLGDIDIAQAR